MSYETPIGTGGGGASGSSGVTTIDFGAFPGKSDTSVTITGQATITAESSVSAWLQSTDTADHSADEHWLETIQIAAGNISAATGFTIYARNSSQLNEPLTTNGRTQEPSVGGAGTRIYGTWTVGWRWS